MDPVSNYGYIDRLWIDYLFEDKPESGERGKRAG